MIQIPGKISITIQPLFFFFAALIGFISSGNLNGTLLWMLVILISVLFHELGHALTALFFGKSPRIELVALGGVTYYEASSLGRGKQFLIVLNGPLFGFILFLLSLGGLKIVAPGWGHDCLQILSLVNFFWTIVNLLPILPLDGGQLLRITLEAFFGVKGVRYALFISMCLASLLAFGSFLYQEYLIGALLFLFAYQGFDTWRKSRHLKPIDQEEMLKKALTKAELSIQDGNWQEAEKELQAVREQTKEGLIYNIATQDLAYMYFKLEKPKEAYFLLKPMKKDLTDEALVVLHNVSAILGDYTLVEELSGSVFQLMPTIDNAIRNAVATAASHKVEASTGWLETARENGCNDWGPILSDPVFDPIRHQEVFQSFLKKIQ